jgi:hypothetical protein
MDVIINNVVIAGDLSNLSEFEALSSLLAIQTSQGDPSSLPSVCPSVHLSICPSVYLSLCYSKNKYHITQFMDYWLSVVVVVVALSELVFVFDDDDDDDNSSSVRVSSMLGSTN